MVQELYEETYCKLHLEGSPVLKGNPVEDPGSERLHRDERDYIFVQVWECLGTSQNGVGAGCLGYNCNPISDGWMDRLM